MWPSRRSGAPEFRRPSERVETGVNTTIVTEGRGGIGLATARTLLRIVRSARSSWWTSTLARPPPAFTDRVHLIACDVTDPASGGRTGADRIGGPPAGGRSGELRRYRHERSHRRHRAGRLHSTPRSSHPRHLGVVTSAGSLTRRAARSNRERGIDRRPVRSPTAHRLLVSQAAVHSMTKTMAVEWAAQGAELMQWHRARCYRSAHHSGCSVLHCDRAFRRPTAVLTRMTMSTPICCGG